MRLVPTLDRTAIACCWNPRMIAWPPPISVTINYTHAAIRLWNARLIAWSSPTAGILDNHKIAAHRQKPRMITCSGRSSLLETYDRIAIALHWYPRMIPIRFIFLPALWFLGE